MNTSQPLAVDVVAQAIRCNPRNTAAGTLAERCLRALHGAKYKVVSRDVHDDLVSALVVMVEVFSDLHADNCGVLNNGAMQMARAALAKAGSRS